MLLAFWNNPEFIRHRRSELRRSRATAVGMVVVVVCALTILACWAQEKSRREAMKGESYEFAITQPDGTVRRIVPPPITIAAVAATESYRWLILMQIGVLGFWSLLSCAQGVSRERDRGTWDFQRTTRLASAELLLGKLFGEPVLAYFIVLCGAPIIFVVGLIGRIGVARILAAYLLLFAGAVFIGLASLLLSSMFENKSRGIVLIGALAMLGVLLVSQGLEDSPFPGLAAFSPLTTLLPLIGTVRPFSPPPTIFGGELPWLAITLLLYVTFGAWIVLMLLRNLKKDSQELLLLSRWQAVACCAFLNFVLYALFSAAHQAEFGNGVDFALFMVAMNGFIFFFLGLAMLNSPERLQVGPVNSLRALFSDHGLQSPWLLLSGLVSYLLLVWGLFAWEKVLGFSAQILERAAISLLIVLLFVTGDVLFIQWCKLTRLRAPLLKGVLFLCLYYASAGVIFGVMSVTSDRAATAVANVLTPVAAFNPGLGLLPASAVVGIVVQLMSIAFFISAIRGRLQRTALVPAAT
jgi:hypothetical protein